MHQVVVWVLLLVLVLVLWALLLLVLVLALVRVLELSRLVCLGQEVSLDHLAVCLCLQVALHSDQNHPSLPRLEAHQLAPQEQEQVQTPPLPGDPVHLQCHLACDLLKTCLVRTRVLSPDLLLALRLPLCPSKNHPSLRLCRPLPSVLPHAQLLPALLLLHLLLPPLLPRYPPLLVPLLLHLAPLRGQLEEVGPFPDRQVLGRSHPSCHQLEEVALALVLALVLVRVRVRVRVLALELVLVLVQELVLVLAQVEV